MNDGISPTPASREQAEQQDSSHLIAPSGQAKRLQPLLDAEQLVRGLLWNEHPECCGRPVVGAVYMGQEEMVCCGCPEPAVLNDAQIVATLRARFPNV